MAQHYHAEWQLPIWTTLFLITTSYIYLRGWLQFRSNSWRVIPPWRAVSFLVGVALIWVAVGSPIAILDHRYLTVHMIQHVLLMTFAAPLVLMGEPVMLLLEGLPVRFGKIIGLISRSPLTKLGKVAASPVFCWLAGASALVVWHVPAAFSLGMSSPAWHVVEQVSFLVTGLFFWWPVVQPWPGIPRWSEWSMILYLFAGTLPCDVLSGFLVFSERVAYSDYLSPATHYGLSALADQECAGALMWTCVTIVFLVAGVVLSTRLLLPQKDSQSLEAL